MTIFIFWADVCYSLGHIWAQGIVIYFCGYVGSLIWV